MMNLIQTSFNQSQASRIHGVAQRGLLTFILWAVGLAVLAGLALSPAYAARPVVSAQELKVLVDQRAVRVFDIRELKGDAKAPSYAEGHIPESLATPYSAFRGPKQNPGQPVAEEKLSELLAGWGVTPKSRVVIAHRGTDGTDFGAAARVYWTLKIAGFSNLSILDGGLAAWSAAGYPLTKDIPSVTKTTVQVKYDRRQIVTQDEIAGLLPTNAANRSGGQTKLLDARPEAFFKGDVRHAAAGRYGTLPGASHFDQEEWFQKGTGKLKSTSEIQATAKASNLLTTDETISFCNTGHWAATNWFILSEVLGQSNQRMYPESMVAWSKSTLPVANEPSRGVIIWRDLKGAVSNLF